MTQTQSLSELVSRLGVARRASQEAYEYYQQLKALENLIREELHMALTLSELRSAKGKDFTVSIASRKRIIVKNEFEVIDWLKSQPDLEYDQYIGLKSRPFDVFATSLLKGKGELVPGTDTVSEESLVIKKNKE